MAKTEAHSKLNDVIQIRGRVQDGGKDGPTRYIEIDFPLRELFAAFALNAVIGLNLDESTHSSDACYAYSAADAMLAAREQRS